MGFAGHLTIADGTKFQAQTGVAQSIKTPNSAYAGSPAYDYNKQIKTFITLRNLPEMERRLRELENKLAFQEDTVNSLSNELLEHQKKIDRLQQQVM